MVEEGCGVGTRADAAVRRTMTGLAAPAAGAGAKGLRGRGGSATVAVVLSCLATAGHDGEWTTANHIASTSAIETSDGADARLEVHCGPEREVRLLHEALDAVPAVTTDKSPGWYGTVVVAGGWGLDLRHPEHRGESTRWWRCPATRGCLRARDTGWTIRELKKSWTWYLRAKPEGRPALDMRFDLAGSGKAIETACREGDQPQR